MDINNPSIYRLIFFFTTIFIFGSLEFFLPRRALELGRRSRWIGNFGISFLSSFLVYISFPIVAITSGEIALRNKWGILNNIEFPFILKILVSVIILDFVIYIQHVLSHHLPLFWKLHRMHHTDVDVDMTTAIRFHPFEIMISMCIKIAAILFLGAPPIAVLIFEIMLNSTTIFNHSNIKIGEKLDFFLRLFWVTPDMHKVHHSIITKETNSNFGFALSIWDRLFLTYRKRPKDDIEKMKIGLKNFRSKEDQKFLKLLLQPFL
jgi:sterol desaturase/sphingolipid hydroxylase (fatty acid hydroxylase superfamily)